MMQFLIKWRAGDHDECTWEIVSDIKDDAALEQFNRFKIGRTNSNSLINFGRLRNFVLAQRLHELLTLDEDRLGKVFFRFGLFGFGLRLEGGLKENLAVGPGLLDNVLEEGEAAGLQGSEGRLLLNLVHKL